MASHLLAKKKPSTLAKGLDFHLPLLPVSPQLLPSPSHSINSSHTKPLVVYWTAQTYVSLRTFA